MENQDNETQEKPTEVQKEDISQVIPVVELVAECGNVAEKIANGNFIAISELADEIFKIPHIDFKRCLVQLKDVDTEERKQIMEIFKDKFDLENDKLELIVEHAIDSAEKTALAVESWMNLSRRIKS